MAPLQKRSAKATAAAAAAAAATETVCSTSSSDPFAFNAPTSSTTTPASDATTKTTITKTKNKTTTATSKQQHIQPKQLRTSSGSDSLVKKKKGDAKPSLQQRAGRDANHDEDEGVFSSADEEFAVVDNKEHASAGNKQQERTDMMILSAAAGTAIPVQRLRFSQRLVPHTAAKPIITSELVKRLQDLHTQLSKLEQDNTDVTSLAVVTRDLVSQSLLLHKDKGVRSLTACCIADILRLYAPDAPYTEHELKEIFAFFLKQIHYIEDGPTSPYFSNYFYLLESLSTVKSVVLVADLGNSEALVAQIFRELFELVRPDFQKNVYTFLLDILQQLVEECPVLNNEVVDTIVAQFNPARKTENSASHQLAVDLCNSATDKLQRYFCNYFSDQFLATAKHANNAEDDEEFGVGGAGVGDEDEFRLAHDMILEINGTARGVLLNVIPMLEEELKCDNVKVRTMATEVIGKMISDVGSRVAVVYPTVWKAWLDRRNDKQINIRTMWFKYVLDILRYHSELCAELLPCLEKKFLDPDEKVRLATTKLFSQLDATAAANVSKELLLQLASRCKDKKISIRLEAIMALGKLFKTMYSEIVSPQDIYAAEKYGWIPGSLLELFYLDDLDTNIAVEKVVHEDLLPVNKDDTARTERMLKIVANLSERQFKAFLSLLDKQSHTIKNFKLYLDQCEEWNGGIMDHDDGSTEKRLNLIIQFLSQKFPDSKKAAGHLMKLATNNENRVYKLFRNILNEASDYETILKNHRELVKRLEQHQGQGLMETFSVFLRRISLTIIGKSSMSPLIQAVQSFKRTEHGEDKGEFRSRTPEQATAEKLIKYLATSFPSIYRSHIREFIALLKSPDHGLVLDALEAISKFAISFPEHLGLSNTDEDALFNLALNGTPFEATKAATILAKLPKSDIRNRLLQHILNSLNVDCIEAAIRLDRKRPWSTTTGGLISSSQSSDDEEMDVDGDKHDMHLASKMCALGQLSRFAYKLVQNDFSMISNFIVKELLLKNRAESTHGEHEWVPFENLDVEGALKVIGIKILVKRVVGCSDPSEARQIAIPVYKLLMKIVSEDGELVNNSRIVTCLAYKSHLRLVAACSLLKLAKIPGLDDLLSVADRAKMMLTIQDPSWEVRDAFVLKLRKYLVDRKIHFKYSVFLVMAGHEPDLEIKMKAKTFLARLTKRSSIADESELSSTLESQFTSVLHMISMHPDFGTTDEDAADSAKYIQLFLDVVATSENVSFLYHSAAQMKTLSDLHNQNSEGIYHLSDLAQILIQEFCSHHGWSLNTYPANVPFDHSLFTKLSRKDGTENLKKSYLSKSFIASRNGAASGKPKSLSSVAPAKTSRRKSAGANRTPVASEDEMDVFEENNEEKADREAVMEISMVKAEKATYQKKKKTAASKRKRGSGNSIENEDDIVDDDEDDDDISFSTAQRRLSAPRLAKTRTKRYSDEVEDVGEDEKADVEDYNESIQGEEQKDVVGVKRLSSRTAQTAAASSSSSSSSESSSSISASASVPSSSLSSRGKRLGKNKEMDKKEEKERDDESEDEVPLVRTNKKTQP